MGREAQGEHKQRGEDEKNLALSRRQDVAGDVLNPIVGAQLNRAHECVRDEEDKQKQRANRELRQHADREQQRATDAPSSGVGQLERVLEEQDEHVSRDGGAEDANLLEHVTHLEPFGRRFRFRERLTEEGNAVEHRRDQEEAELNLPAHAVFTERPADKSTNDESRRPRSVQDVQVVGAVFGEQRGDQRISDGFQGAVCQGKHEGAPIKEVIGKLLRLTFARRKSDEGGQDMEKEGRKHQFAIADLVHHDATDDDAEAKTREPGSANCAQLRSREAEVSAPVCKNAAADAKADAGRQNGQEAGPQQPFGIRRNAVV